MHLKAPILAFFCDRKKTEKKSIEIFILSKNLAKTLELMERSHQDLHNAIGHTRSFNLKRKNCLERRNSLCCGVLDDENQ